MNLKKIVKSILYTILFITLESASAMNENLSTVSSSKNPEYYKILTANDANRNKLIDIATKFLMRDNEYHFEKEFYILEMISETNLDYGVTFVHKDLPANKKGQRGYPPGMPAYTVYIDKVTFKVIKRAFSR
jgi:hypothetical protein